MCNTTAHVTACVSVCHLTHFTQTLIWPCRLKSSSFMFIIFYIERRGRIYISDIPALNRLCKWSFCLFPSHSLRLFTIPLGAFRDPLHCFVWMTLKDNGSLDPWPALGVCVNLHLSIGSAVLRCQERLCDLCVTEGVFHRWELEPQGEGLILCERSWVRVRGLWNFIEASELKQHIASVLMWAYDSCCRADIPK